ncbi:uncharacterized protein ColSpa_00598 [Colletotrichum spaethianum]|uniref:Uncharacterized protein n=1 Tax=Colletotrichum spaethianum TaxID=700344 RepID=A0AA37NT40_9PEZI|nr:uncharacterized protein ColSpa_00598 [Colletotrichum spaethianum]GKT40417.1 hypothetical protein ColSpa_00598 [Colletotrichum spaethianum]
MPWKNSRLNAKTPTTGGGLLQGLVVPAPLVPSLLHLLLHRRALLSVPNHGINSSAVALSGVEHARGRDQTRRHRRLGVRLGLAGLELLVHAPQDLERLLLVDLLLLLLAAGDPGPCLAQLLLVVLDQLKRPVGQCLDGRRADELQQRLQDGERRRVRRLVPHVNLEQVQHAPLEVDDGLLGGLALLLLARRRLGALLEHLGQLAVELQHVGIAHVRVVVRGLGLLVLIKPVAVEDLAECVVECLEVLALFSVGFVNLNQELRSTLLVRLQTSLVLLQIAQKLERVRFLVVKLEDGDGVEESQTLCDLDLIRGVLAGGGALLHELLQPLACRVDFLLHLAFHADVLWVDGQNRGAESGLRGRGGKAEDVFDVDAEVELDRIDVLSVALSVSGRKRTLGGFDVRRGGGLHDRPAQDLDDILACLGFHMLKDLVDSLALGHDIEPVQSVVVDQVVEDDTGGFGVRRRGFLNNLAGLEGCAVQEAVLLCGLVDKTGHQVSAE